MHEKNSTRQPTVNHGNGNSSHFPALLSIFAVDRLDWKPPGEEREEAGLCSYGVYEELLDDR